MLGALVFLPIGELSLIQRPVAIVVAIRQVVLHRIGDDTFIIFIEGLITLLGNLKIRIIAVVCHRADTRCGIHERTLHQTVVGVILKRQQTLPPVRLHHRGTHQIAVLVVFPFHHICRIQTTRGIEVQDFLFHHRILGDHLLHLTFQTQMRGILIIGR